MSKELNFPARWGTVSLTRIWFAEAMLHPMIRDMGPESYCRALAAAGLGTLETHHGRERFRRSSQWTSGRIAEVLDEILRK